MHSLSPIHAALFALAQGSGVPSPLQSIDRAALAPVVEPVLAEANIPGVVVAIVRGKELLLLEAFGLREIAKKSPMRVEDLFQIGSVTKTFTAALLTQAAAKGELSLDDPLAQWLDDTHELPEWAHDVTLQQIATHTAGIPRDAPNRRNVPDSPSVAEPYSLEELYAALPSTRPIAAPGARWSYSNLGFGLLGHVLERATGKRYEELLRERVFAPLGMSDSGIQPTAEQEARLAPGYWFGDPEPVARPRWRFGEVCAFGGIFSSARDLSRYVTALLASGDAGPFTDATRSLLFTPQVDAQAGQKMGLAWFVDRPGKPDETIEHGGEVDSYSSDIVLRRDAHVGVIVLANRGGDSATRVCRAIQERVLPRLTAPASR